MASKSSPQNYGNLNRQRVKEDQTGEREIEDFLNSWEEILLTDLSQK